MCKVSNVLDLILMESIRGCLTKSREIIEGIFRRFGIFEGLERLHLHNSSELYL